jgi:hypothetical protein
MIRNLSMPPVSNQHGLTVPRAKESAIQGAFSGYLELYLIENKGMVTTRAAIFITGL